MTDDRIDQCEQNLANLLKHAYQPEAPEESFAARVKARLHQEAGKQPVRPARPARPPLTVGQRLAWVVGIAAVVAGLSFPLRWALDHQTVAPIVPGADDASPGRLTAKARAPQPSIEKAAVGQVLETREGQRRRLALPDGTILFLNESTKVTVSADRELVLAAGEIYVETAPKLPGAPNLTVRTGTRELVSLGTRFGVRAGNDTNVLVTQGKVGVSGSKQLIHAGEEWLASSNAIKPAPRFAHALDWTRELVIAAESPLVPASQFAGGALLAVDPEGQEAKLSLRRYHVDVHIEDGFARTTIDQTYFNHQPWRLEGTFYFPLPADASLSRLAMYVDNGNGESVLNEGGMCERNEGRAIYDQIRESMRDPALLEWLDGSTFKMKVFPLEGRQEKRILLSYTQRLESLYGHDHYRFPAGHNLQVIRDWSFQARVKHADALSCNSPSHKFDEERKQGDLFLSTSGKNVKADKDIVLDVFVNAGAPGKPQGEEESCRLSTAVHEGHRYLMVRYRPELVAKTPVANTPGSPRNWIFLFESSGDRDPLLARVQIEVIRELLGQVEHEDTFAVVSASTRQHIVPSKTATVDNVKQALTTLEGSHLIGALDLNAALTAALDLQAKGRDNYLVHVGSGVAALGERREDELARKLPENVRYVGVGVGKRWSRSFMKQAAERTGGFFTQINPDEPIGWRTFELYSSIKLPRLLNIKVGDAEERGYLTFVSSLSQGEELCAVTRLPEDMPLPAALAVTGNVNGQPYRRELPVTKTAPLADYLPRLWAKLEIDRLYAEDSTKHREKIIKMSKEMYVMTPFTSLLVLENDAMYKEFGVDRGRKDHWAMYPSPAKIPTVFEPDPAHPGNGNVKSRKPRKVQDVLNTILTRQAATMIQRNHVEYSVKGAARLHGALADSSIATNGGPGNVESWGRLPEASRQLGLSTIRLGRLELGQRYRSAATRHLDDGIRADENKRAGQLMSRVSRNDERLAEYLNRGEERAGRFLQLASAKTASAEFDRLEKAVKQNYFVTPRLMVNEETAQIRDYYGFYANHNLDGAEEPIAFKDSLKKLLELSDQTLEREWIGGLLAEYQSARRLYQRPEFSGDERLLYDLLAYAPGLNTTVADMEAIVDAEAETLTRPLPGRVEAGARQLIDAARKQGWRSLELNGNRLTFDGQGRYHTRRTLPFGLEEIEICDGDTILHLYPEIGLAARRPVNMFQRIALSKRLPYVLPEADDLAVGHDLTLKDERTVVMAPRDAANQKDKAGKLIPYGCFHLVFAEGALAERRLVRVTAEGKEELVARETFAADGVVKVLDKDDKVLVERKAKLEAATAPDLKAATADLVVLNMPWRSSNHVRNVADLRGPYRTLKADDALALLAGYVAENNSEALSIYRECFHARGDRRHGFATLLAAVGIDLDPTRIKADVMHRQQAITGLPRVPREKPSCQSILLDHPEAELARYLAYFTDNQARSKRTGMPRFGTTGGLLERLSTFNDLRRYWQSGRAARGLNADAEWTEALAFVKANPNPLGWGLLNDLNHRGEQRAAIAQAYGTFADVPALAYAARYERAATLLAAGQIEEGHKLFGELYDETLKSQLPAIDHRFQRGEANFDAAVKLLIKEERRLELVALAWQCKQRSAAEQAEEIIGLALEGIKEPAERLAVTLAVVDYLREANEIARALALLQPMLDDDRLGKLPFLWHQAAALAGRRENREEVIPYLEKALAMEFAHGPDVVDLQRIRRDYGQLLGYYQELAGAMRTLNAPVPADFAARVVRCADQWRALDLEQSSDVCQRAARILKLVGARELAWDYMTTPVALHPHESEPWLHMARTLAGEGEYLLADRAYQASFEADPTNAQLLWDRAKNLEQAGKRPDAVSLYRQLAQGKWQLRFRWLREQAEKQVGMN